MLANNGRICNIKDNTQAVTITLTVPDDIASLLARALRDGSWRGPEN